MLHSNRFCVQQFPALTRRCQHRGPTRATHPTAGAPTPNPPHDGAPQPGEPAGHRLGARYARRGSALATVIHPAQLAHHTPIPATLLTHRTLMITLINRQPPRTRLSHLRHHTHTPLHLENPGPPHRRAPPPR